MCSGCLRAGSPAPPARRGAPLVEAVGRQQAAVPAEGHPERRLLGDGLAARVDHPRADRRILRPARDETPAHADELALTVGVDAHDRHFGHRRDVVARVHVRWRRQAEGQRDGRRMAVQLVASAHRQAAGVAAPADGTRRRAAAAWSRALPGRARDLQRVPVRVGADGRGAGERHPATRRRARDALGDGDPRLVSVDDSALATAAGRRRARRRGRRHRAAPGSPCGGRGSTAYACG